MEKLSKSLRDNFADALLFKRIATVELDVAVGAVDDWEWPGPTDRFEEAATVAGVPELVGRAYGALKRRANRHG